MNLHLLRIFYTVAMERSFSRAADVLCISQPAVSKGVRELEHQLEIGLIERAQGAGRRQQGVQLTTNGTVLFEHARGLFALEKAAVDDLHARLGLKRGALVVGASSTIAGYWLAPVLGRFAESNPDIDLQVKVGNTESVCQALIDCQVDVALVEGEVNDSRMHCRPWLNDPLTVIAPPSLRLADGSVKALARQCWIEREPGSGTREVVRGLLTDCGVKPDRQIEMGSNEAIARAVASGLGLAMLPRAVVSDLIMLERVVEVALPDNPDISRPLYELEYTSRPLSPAAQAFTSLLRESAAKT
ncbi:LysR substrate-binding domain-containing protein [Marinobacter sp. 1Y8]